VPHSDARPEGGGYDAVVVGAGFAGIYMLYRLRELGLTARVFEAAERPGGTWFHNRYPGARCDVQSFDYSYSFSEELQQEWSWSERYATQPEILSYLDHVVERFDLARDIQCNTRITSADFDESANRWTLHTEDGESYTARFAIMATGCLSVPKRPQIPGLETFEGDWYLAADWPAEGVDLTGRRVGLIGTGSTGIQFATAAAGHVEHLCVFQRSPNFSLPAQNRPLDKEFERELKATYPERRAAGRLTTRGYPVPDILGDRPALEVSPDERRRVFERVWANGGPVFTSCFPDQLVDQAANETAAEYVRERIRRIVADPDTARLLSPVDHPLGTRRPCVDTGYYEVFNRENVTLVDARSAPIEAITPTGLRTTEESYELDTIVFAIGFDAMTGALLRMEIGGVGGVALREKWADGPVSYLGLGVAGFPNLFTVTGPGSPSVLTNMVASIEQHVDWITDLIRHAHDTGIERVEASIEAESAWVRHVAATAEATLLPLANSWWNGANVAGKPRVFMPYAAGLGRYGEVLDAVARKGYEGFELS
jgi:cation diffusion facilitator CzcD-associated flavoprotein CzcO